MASYTIVDLLGTAKAAVAMSLIVFVPGYVLGWTLNVLGFRDRRLILKGLLSVTLGIACCPVITYLLGRMNRHVVWIFYFATWTLFAVLVARAVRKRDFTLPQVSRHVRFALAAVLAWIVLGMGSLVDIQLGDRLYYSVPAYDYSVRTAFTAAAARSIPPNNPFFASTDPVPLRYHYFWLLLCMLVAKTAAVTPREAMFGATLWCGIALMSLVALWVKFYLRPVANVERKSLIGAALLLVTGLDIIPTIILRFQQPHVVKPDMEWWNVAQITSWIDSMLWVPHHLAGLIACLTGFLVLYVEKRRAVAATIAAIAFASAVGLSIYVAFTFALFMAVWILVSLIQDRRRAPTLVVVAVLALCLLLPYALTLAGPGNGGFVVPELRPFSFVTNLLESHGVQSFWAEEVAPAVLLPLNYLLELGFFLLVGLNRVRKVWTGSVAFTRDEITAWLAVASSFAVGTFLRSNTITSNDLGYRSFLIAQFFLLLWAIPVIESWFFSRRDSFARRPATAIAIACLALGVVATTYQVLELRFYSVAADHGGVFRRSWMDGDGQLGRRTYALRQAYEALDKTVGPQSVVQFNPLTPTYLPHLLYTAHPAAAVGRDCGTQFGGASEACAPRIQELSGLFEDGITRETLNVDEVCRTNLIDVLVAKDSDPVWRDRSSWVWREQPIVANRYVRAFLCGNSGPSQAAQQRVQMR